MIRKVHVVGLAVVLAACGGGGAPAAESGAATETAAPAATDPAAVRAAIDAANKAGVESFNAGTPDGMLANYAEDAVVMMSGMKAMIGKAAITEGMKGMFTSMDMKNFSTTTADVMVSGDMAVETGTLIYDSGPKGGTLVSDTAKYLTVWKKQRDGSWKIVRDINNTDIAPK
jgi:uncharacterized protein (TIGR02246 family)